MCISFSSHAHECGRGIESDVIGLVSLSLSVDPKYMEGKAITWPRCDVLLYVSTNVHETQAALDSGVFACVFEASLRGLPILSSMRYYNYAFL